MDEILSNDLFAFLQVLHDGAWVYFCAVLVLATGLVLFDRRTAGPAKHEAEKAPERRAA